MNRIKMLKMLKFKIKFLFKHLSLKTPSGSAIHTSRGSSFRHPGARTEPNFVAYLLSTLRDGVIGLAVCEEF